MASFNKTILVGNMTADPELKQTAAGVSVCTFSIAVNRRFAKAEQGQTAVDFFPIVAWRQQAEFVARYFKKGIPILVCGELQNRSWTDKQGQKRYTTEVVADEVAFVAPAAQNGSEDNAKTNQGYGYAPSAYTAAPPQFEDIPDDGDLPF